MIDGMDAAPPPATPSGAESRRPVAFTVQVERSRRRRTTYAGQMVGDVLKVVVPTWMSNAEIDAAVAAMTEHFRRKQSTERFDLPQRAASLARRYGLPTAADVRWGGEMSSRWGSCTPGTGVIRLSTRLAAFPDWVVDYVIVHELAHLAVPDHSAAFWQLVRRYGKAERATGFLIAKSAEATDWL